MITMSRSLAVVGQVSCPVSSGRHIGQGTFLSADRKTPRTDRFRIGFVQVRHYFPERRAVEFVADNRGIPDDISADAQLFRADAVHVLFDLITDGVCDCCGFCRKGFILAQGFELAADFVRAHLGLSPFIHFQEHAQAAGGIQHLLLCKSHSL